ncbi:hypothetical protein D9M72_471150 [compost metagenome]
MGHLPPTLKTIARMKTSAAELAALIACAAVVGSVAPAASKGTKLLTYAVLPAFSPAPAADAVNAVSSNSTSLPPASPERCRLP